MRRAATATAATTTTTTASQLHTATSPPPPPSPAAALEAELNSSKERLAQCQRELSGLDAKVAELKADFQKRTAEAETLKVSLAKAEAVLGSAQTLLEKLSGERGRWEEMAAEYNEEMRSIAGSALLAAAFITYLADESEATRAARMDEWSGMLRTAGLLGVPKGDPLAKGGGFSVTRFLSSEGELLKWKAQGLPADKLSAENAIVILHAPRERTPLIIDPSSQATEWLKAKLAAGGGAIEVLTPHEGRFVNGLELGVRFGKTLLIGEVDQVSAILPQFCRNSAAILPQFCRSSAQFYDGSYPSSYRSTRFSSRSSAAT